MEIRYGDGKTEYGPGVLIGLTGDEVAIAISAWLVAHGIHIDGARTIRVNSQLCGEGEVYVDPSGFVIHDGEKMSGCGPAKDVNSTELCPMGVGCDEYGVCFAQAHGRPDQCARS